MHRFSCAAAVLAVGGALFVGSGTVSAAPPAKSAAAQNAAAANKLNVAVTLSDGVRTVKRTRRELGFTLASASPVAFTVDQGALKNALGRIAPKFRAEAQPARPVKVGGRVRVKGGRHARALNIPTTATLLAAEVAKNPAARTFRVSLIKNPPALSAERLKGVTGVLGTATTRATGTQKRDHNIALAVARIDGTLLSPGETFSLNETVGKRTQASGFRTAKVFEDGKITAGIGGGVSQVTGTLFNAAAKAGLKIDEAHPHSRPVAYLPVGYDATVAYGAKDLRFTNNTGAPVFVEYRFEPNSGRLTARLWGARVPGKVVRLKVTSQRLAPGKIDAQLYRIVKKGGQVVQKERLVNHQYRWDPKDKG